MITGAGSGLGRESALLFAREGANVVVTDLNEKRALAVAEQIGAAGGAAVAVRADVRDAAEMDAAVAAAVAEFGRLDVMFANAGVPPEGFGTVAFEDFTLDAWHAVNVVVLTGVFLSCQAAVRQFKRQGDGGTIVVTGSAGGTTAYPGFFAYCAGKAGAHHLVKCLAFDLGRYGIRANALAPTHGMSINFVMPPDADVLGQSYEEVAAAATGGWNPRISPIPLKKGRPLRRVTAQPVTRSGTFSPHAIHSSGRRRSSARNTRPSCCGLGIGPSPLMCPAGSGSHRQATPSMS